MRKNFFFFAALAAFLCALLLPGMRAQAGFDCVALALVAAQEWRALAVAGTPRFWIFPAAFVALAPFFAPEGATRVLGLAYDSARLGSGMLLLLHAYVFAALCACAGRRFTMRQISEACERAGFPGIGFRTALVFCSARRLGAMMLDTWRNYSLTRPGWKALLGEADVLAGAVVRNAALCAEEISTLLFIRNVKI